MCKQAGGRCMSVNKENMVAQRHSIAAKSATSQEQSSSDDDVKGRKDDTRKTTEAMSAKTSKRCGQTQDKNEPPKKRSKGKHHSPSPTLTTKGFQRHFAKHNYHDYSKEEPTRLDLDHIKSTRGGVQNPFPSVLHNMMEQAEEKGYSDIVSWQSHGRAFLIHKPKEFVAQVLPMFFKHSKLASFQRQLSLYGFIRLTHDGLDRGAYYHECFLRGRYFLCSKIVRTRVKGTWVRTSSSPESEPDFYKMESVGNDLDNESAMISDTISNEQTQASDENGATRETFSNTFTPVIFNRDYTPGTRVSGSVDQPAAEHFSDTVSSDLMKELNRPAPDAGLQPPPFFPSEVFKPDFHKPISSWPTSATLFGKYNISSLIVGALADSAARPISPTTASSADTQRCFEDSSVQARISNTWTLSNDDELAHFLLDVDLETENFDISPTGIQMTGV